MTRLGGWCLDGFCDDCRYPSCSHSCHTHAAEMVAQTFDRDHQSKLEHARIAVRIDGSEGAVNDLRILASLNGTSRERDVK